MTFNEMYLQARKRVRVAKRAPGEYHATHRSPYVRAVGKKREHAVQLCAMRVAAKRTKLGC